MKRLGYTELSNAALFLSKSICRAHNRQNDSRYNDLWETEQRALALFIWKFLCELHQFGHARTRPEDLFKSVSWNFRAYEFRGYPNNLVLLARAFARQFCDFDTLPRKVLAPTTRYTLWRFYEAGWQSSVAQFDGWCHHFFIRNIPSLNAFGDWFVGEYWYEEDSGTHREVIAVPFKTQEEAKFFLLQLADSLNSNDESQCNITTQFVCDVIAQAPLEAMQIELEREAESKAEQDRKKQMVTGNGTHVYILDFGNGQIKIGASCNVQNRIAQAHTFGQVTTRYAVSKEGFEFVDAYIIEKKCHAKFKSQSVTDEVFRVSYDKAKAYLEKLTPVIELENDRSD